MITETMFNPLIYTYIAIGLGIVISLFLSETLGITAGGIIVPGYIGLYLNNYEAVFITFALSVITFLIVKLLSEFILIYGRRRLVLCILIGFFLGALIRNVYQTPSGDILYIGFIIPGLISSWIDRQGAIRTISVILIVSCIVHLFLLIIWKFGLVNV